MMTVKPIRRRYGENICRACINESYRAHLEPKDCLYSYTYTCPRCGWTPNDYKSLPRFCSNCGWEMNNY